MAPPFRYDSLMACYHRLEYDLDPKNELRLGDGSAMEDCKKFYLQLQKANKKNTLTMHIEYEFWRTCGVA